VTAAELERRLEQLVAILDHAGLLASDAGQLTLRRDEGSLLDRLEDVELLAAYAADRAERAA
jgi:hypothetical protein